MESGEYEQRGVDAVFASPDAALPYLRNLYGIPYVVDWIGPVKDDWGFYIEGVFQRVIGYSTNHTARYELAEWDVHEVGEILGAPVGAA